MQRGFGRFGLISLIAAILAVTSAMGGASYLKSLKAPLPQIKIVPTGGVSLKTAADFIKAGAEAVGVGADLVDLQAVRENRADSITATARQYVEIVKQARGV